MTTTVMPTEVQQWLEKITTIAQLHMVLNELSATCEDNARAYAMGPTNETQSERWSVAQQAIDAVRIY